MLRKYGRLHTTSTTSIGTFKICLHLVCPCPLKLLLVLVRFLVFLSVFHCFPTAEVPMRRAYSVAAIQGLWPTQQIVNAVRTSIALVYRRTIPMLLGFSGRFADLGVRCSCESQKVKSCVLSSRFTSFSKRA